MERKRIGQTDLVAGRMGLAGGYGLPHEDVLWAVEQGVDYLWWHPDWEGMTAALRELLPQHRGRLILASAFDKFDGAGALGALEERLKLLGTDYLDVFIFAGAGGENRPELATSDGLAAITKAREQGKVRYISFTTHDRPTAARLAATGAFDLVTIRYNAAHVGAETEVFPVVQQHGVGVVIYTPLSWGQLLSPPASWKEDVPRSWEIYRFVLEHPAVDVVMTGPKTREQLAENLGAVEGGYRLSPERLEDLHRYGQLFRQEMQ